MMQPLNDCCEDLHLLDKLVEVLHADLEIPREMGLEECFAGSSVKPGLHSGKH